MGSTFFPLSTAARWLFSSFFCRAEGVARGSRVLSFSFENQPTMARRQATEETAWLCSPWPRDVAFLPATTPPTPCPLSHELPARRYAQGCSRVLNGICLRFLQEVRLCHGVDTRRGKPRTTHQAPKNRPCARIIKNKGCIFFSEGQPHHTRMARASHMLPAPRGRGILCVDGANGYLHGVRYWHHKEDDAETRS